MDLKQKFGGLILQTICLVFSYFHYYIFYMTLQFTTTLRFDIICSELGIKISKDIDNIDRDKRCLYLQIKSNGKVNQ